MSAPTIDSRRRGALLGLAIGDALGAAVEFSAPGTFAPVTGYRGGGPHGLAPGEWTDDTSMALALADSLSHHPGDLDDQARRYVSWWRHGQYSVTGRCFDIGIATREALARFERGTPAAEAGDTADAKSGNGSIMRLAPVAMRHLALYPARAVELADHAEASSRTTHRSDKCLSACRYLAVVLAALMHGVPREEVLAPTWPMLDTLHNAIPLHPDVLAVARGSFRERRPPAIRGTGYVVASLEAALWAFHAAPSFEDAVLAAVNLGEDADTTGAVCGQLAGAHFGTEGMPPAWLEGLARRGMLDGAVERLVAAAESDRGAVGGVDEAPRPEIPSTHVALPTRADLATEADAPPTERCYWVVPGRLLAGAYPGMPEPKAHEARVDALWRAGVRSVVNLMESHERDLEGRPFRPYGAVFATHAAEGDFDLRHAPMVDGGVPSEGAMLRALDAIDAELSRGRCVYVHCFGGIGRTGMVVGCWLVRHGLVSSDEVLEVLARLRAADVARSARRSPETDGQIAFLRAWSARR